MIRQKGTEKWRILTELRAQILFNYLTVVPEAGSRAGRGAASDVVGRFALVGRGAAAVADELLPVAGRDASKEENDSYISNMRKMIDIPVVRVWDGGRSLAAAVLLVEGAEAAARDAAVEAVKCEETPVAPLVVVVFVGGFGEGRTVRVLGFVVAVELEADAVAVAELPSGAVESIVVS